MFVVMCRKVYWHREEIHGGNSFPMVAKKGQPALGVVGISRRFLHPTGDGSLGKLKIEHAEFPMDPRRSPLQTGN
jgi:hypothetical protein